MNEWLALQLEKSPEFTFYEWELKMHCPEHQELIADGYLFRDLKAEGSEFCFTKWGRRLQLLRIEGSIFGTDTDDTDEPIVEVDPRDIIRYRFNWEPWSQKVRERNGINGSSTWLDKYLLFLGQRNYSGQKLGFILGFFNHRDEAMNLLLSLPARTTSNYDVLAVTTLCFNRLPQQDMANLERLHVYMVPPINPQTLTIECPRLLLSKRQEMPSIVLSHTQEADYHLYGYKCRLPVHITGEMTKSGNNIILIGDTVVEIGDVPFRLFLRLVLELCRTKMGTVSKVDLRSEEYLSADGEFQSIGRLRECFVRTLGDLHPERFIESYRPKTLRLSVHPDLVTWDQQKLLGHDDARVRDLVGKLAAVG